MRRAVILAVLLLVSGGLFGLWRFLEQMPAEAPEAAPQATSAYEMLYEHPLADFQRMDVRLNDGSGFAMVSDMVFDESGALLGVRSGMGQPLLVEGQESFALSSLSWQMMILTAQHLPYTAAYTGLDLDACGLTNPAARITITYQTESPVELTVGRMTASGHSCYVTSSGDDRVFLVPYDFHEVMTKPLAAHHILPSALSVQTGSAVQIAQLDADGTLWLATYSGDQLLPWQVEKPFPHGGSTDRITAFIEGVCALHAEGYETTVGSMPELAAYGLDAPQRLLVAFTDGTIRDVHVGGDAGSGQVYARMDQSGDIYRISRAQLSFLDSAGGDGLLDRFVALIPSSQVTSVAMSMDGQRHTLTRDGQEGAAVYAQDGIALSTKEFSARYKALIGLSFDKTASNISPAGEPLACVTYQLQSGETQEITLYPWDAYYDLCKTGAGGAFLVRHTRVAEIWETLCTVN